MNSHGDDKHEPDNPENAMRMIELELMQQRAARQRAGAPYRGLRIASMIFLLVIIVGALLAFYYFFYSGGLDELRTRNTPEPTPSTVPTPPVPR